MTIHPDFGKVKHLASVQEAMRGYKSVYSQGGPVLKDAETKLNAAVEKGVSPQQGYAKGGKVAKTGAAKVHKGEQVVKKSSAQKYGPSKMSSVNRGTAKVTAKGKR